jgi:hypothetical protein
METKFQTSFIPKKPLVLEQKAISAKKGTSIIMVVATVLFLASIVGAVFSVVWIGVLNKDQINYKKKLADSEKKFDIPLIEELKKINKKLNLSKEFLASHLSAGEVFSIISQLAVENVRFSSFTFEGPSKDSQDIKITLSGTAKDPYAIAYQSDVFGKSKEFGKYKILKNPVISNVSEQDNGGVQFSFSGMISSDDLLYTKLMPEYSNPVNSQVNTPTQ